MISRGPLVRARAFTINFISFRAVGFRLPGCRGMQDLMLQELDWELKAMSVPVRSFQLHILMIHGHMMPLPIHGRNSQTSVDQVVLTLADFLLEVNCI